MAQGGDDVYLRSGNYAFSSDIETVDGQSILPGGTPGRCTGTLRLRNRKLGAVGKGTFSIRPGRTPKVKVTLTGKALARLADRGKLSTPPRRPRATASARALAAAGP
ncbi:MAG: hypothetical protein ACJ760_01955 [Thermoleophilaceae bacterium]